MIRLGIILLGLFFAVATSYATRVELFTGQVVHGKTFAKDGLISIVAKYGTYQYRMPQVKSLKSSGRQWITSGALIELKKESNYSSESLVSLYEGTTLQYQGVEENGFLKVEVYGETGFVDKGLVTRFIEYPAPLKPVVEFTTDKGVFHVELFEDIAPNTTANMIHLVEKGFYSNMKIHRREDNFIVQMGDPVGDGEGGPGYTIPSEISPDLKNLKGYVGMAENGPSTAGSQFYVLLQDAPHLDGKFTVFGYVTEGFDVASKLQVGDSLLGCRVIKKRDHPYIPETVEPVQE
jgi:cyclophilin family peptidyl-prolyl cis-trans isomerase